MATTPPAVRGAGRWPLRHTAQLVLVLVVLQPLLLLLTVVDFARVWPSAAGTPWIKVLVAISRVLRPGVGRVAPLNGSALLRESALSLQGAYITQAWFASRMASWHDVAAAYAQGEPAAVARKKQHSVTEQLERIVLTSCALPLLWCGTLLVAVLCGAPVDAHFGGTAVFAAYAALLVVFPVVHILGPPPSHVWTRVLAAPQLAEPTEVLVLVPALCATLGAAAGGLALALDWGRAWQTWPLPSVYGMVLGVIVGNGVALGMCARRHGDVGRGPSSEPGTLAAAPKSRRRRGKK